MSFQQNPFEEDFDRLIPQGKVEELFVNWVLRESEKREPVEKN